MQTISRVSTTDMEVTSIRLERELKDKLKAIAGHRGYQALVRDILWDYVQHQSANYQPQISLHDIQATFPATAQAEQRCALTGRVINAQEPMLIGWVRAGEMVPLSPQSITP